MIRIKIYMALPRLFEWGGGGGMEFRYHSGNPCRFHFHGYLIGIGTQDRGSFAKSRLRPFWLFSSVAIFHQNQESLSADLQDLFFQISVDFLSCFVQKNRMILFLQPFAQSLRVDPYTETFATVRK